MSKHDDSFLMFSTAEDYSAGLSRCHFNYTIRGEEDSLTVSHIHQLGASTLTYSIVGPSHGVFSRKPDDYNDYLAIRFIRRGSESHKGNARTIFLEDYTIGIFDLQATSVYERKKATEGINLFIEKNHQTKVLLAPSSDGWVLLARQGVGRYLLDSIFSLEEQFSHCSIDENKLMLNHFITLFCTWVTQNGQPGDGKARAYQHIMARASDYIRAHLWDSELSIEKAADHCQISVRTLQTVFQSENISFSQYLNDLRLTASAVKLFRSADDITAIAFQCGFSNSAYFSKRFKEKYNLSPTAYRKNSQQLLDAVKREIDQCQFHDWSMIH